jgi:uncharacterized membrane protein YbhN (UPF0104 family)
MTDPRRRITGGTLLKAGFLVVALGFGAAFVAEHWSETKEALSTLGPGPVLLALGCGALAQVTAMLAWRTLLADLGHPLPYAVAARVFYVSQLGKYIPGSVWQLAALVELGRQHHVPRRDLAVSGVVTLMVSVTTAGLFGGLLLLLGGVEGARHWLWTAPVAVAAAVICLHPRFAVPIVDLVLRTLKRQPLTQPWTEPGMLRMIGWQTLTWLLLGLQCWALVVGLGAPARASAFAAIGGFAVAYALGMLFIPAPAGAGVREAVLGALLAGSLTSGGVVVAVLLSRVLLAMLDVAFGAVAGAAGGWAKRAGHSDLTDAEH